jgi:hypothetical protein
MTRIETVEKSRNAMAPPESTMTGRVLPAGCSELHLVHAK